MAYKEEIELKFLVREDALPPLPPGARLVQGYLGTQPTVRVRTEESPGQTPRAFLTIKGEGLVGRDEFEYDIPIDEGKALLGFAQGCLISKTRYRLPVTGAPGLAWEIDVFEGDNKGLIVAEIELPGTDFPFERPDWLGKDVTRDPAYKNAALAHRPYCQW